MYAPRRPSRNETVPVRNLRYHVHAWGPAASPDPLLVLLHGWMDVGASWQFVVDALQQERRIIAPDWRGFGRTDGGGVDNYWLPDYMADLDWLLDHYAGDQPVDLVGHSMGGNVAMQYAGVRPARIRRLVNVEGFGMPAREPVEAPERYGRWIDELKRLHRGELALRAYDSRDGVARRLAKTNPRLSADKAQWLAGYWAARHSRPDGTEAWEILGDAAHKVVNANIFRVDETLALYSRISAPVLALVASDDSLGRWWNGRYTLDDFQRRLQSVPDARLLRIDDCGHMLHHDQPLRVAQAIERFLQDAADAHA